MHRRWFNKYLYSSNLYFTLGPTVKKAILSFFLPIISFVTPKNFNFDRPPLRVVCPFQDFLTNIRYFSLNIWVVYDHLELDWCVFDQNWAKSRPLHFRIFQILKASDRPIVQCSNCLKPYDMSHQKKTDKPNSKFFCSEIFWYWFQSNLCGVFRFIV